MRLFTAIDIAPHIRRHLAAWLDRLRPLAQLTWTREENLHVTTKFIGEWPENRIDDVNRVLGAVPRPGASIESTVEIAVRGLGWFPNDRNPRVFWAGIESGPELAALARATEESLARIGVPVEERTFNPHLTLARRRNPVPLDRLRKELAAIPSDDFGSFRAESFFLYLSRGGKYTKLNEFPLLSRL